MGDHDTCFDLVELAASSRHIAQTHAALPVYSKFLDLACCWHDRLMCRLPVRLVWEEEPHGSQQQARLTTVMPSTGRHGENHKLISCFS